MNRDLQAALAITTAQKTDLFDQFNLLFEQDCASQAQINDLKSQVASLQFTLSAEHEMLEEKAVQIRSLERALETSASEVQDMVATSAHEKVALEQHIDRIADEKVRRTSCFISVLSQPRHFCRTAWPATSLHVCVFVRICKAICCLLVRLLRSSSSMD